MKMFLQFVIIGLGIGATYTLFAQGAVLIYRGSGLVNFAQGALGTLSAYVAFVELTFKHHWSTLPAMCAGVLASVAVAVLFQGIVLRRLRRASALVRVISTIALLGLVQAITLKRYDGANRAVSQYLPHKATYLHGVKVHEDRLYLLAISVAVTALLWGWMRYTRASVWRSTRLLRTNEPCRRSAGHPTSSPR